MHNIWGIPLPVLKKMQSISKDVVKRPLKDLVTVAKRGLSSYYINTKDEGVETVTLRTININNIVDGKVDQDNPETIEVRKTGSLNETRLAVEDILVTVRGSVFRAGLIDEKSAGSTFNSNLVALHCNNQISPEILTAWLNSSEGRKEMEVRATGATIQGLKVEELLSIEVPVPSAREQELLIKLLELAQEKKQLLKRETEILELLMDEVIRS